MENIQQQDPREEALKNFKVFLTNTYQNFGIYYENLEKIIELHILSGDKASIYNELQQNLTYTFNMEGIILLEYLKFPGILKIDDLSLEPKIFKKQVDFINKIKIKYGCIISSSALRAQMPFLINSVETNVGNNESAHILKVGRADGVSLEGVFKSETLLMIITSLIASVEMSMRKGIYTLNSQTVESYNKQVQNFDVYLKELMNPTKGE